MAVGPLSLSPGGPAAEADEYSMRGLARWSLAIILIGFGGFFLWAFLARLDSAVTAEAFVVVESHLKTVSILDAGILDEMMVKEGDQVGEGQILFRLSRTQAAAQVAQLRGQLAAAWAKAARLRAERDGQHDLTVPPELAALASDKTGREFLANERALLAARWQAYQSQLDSAQAKVAQSRQEIDAFRATGLAARQQLAYNNEELAGILKLLAKGYETKRRVLELQSATAALSGAAAEAGAHEAESRKAMAGAESDLQALRTARLSDVAHDLQDTETAAAALDEQLKAAQDIAVHKEVRAPQAGTVTHIQFFTPGSSIVAGAPILDIVPRSDRLLVEGQVAPKDVERLALGQRVNVRLLAFRQEKVPILPGRLTYISADKTVDAKGDSWFTVRAELDSDAFRHFPGLRLYPGMSAELYIIGSERRAIDYLLEPLTDGFQRAFHEQ